MLFMGDEKIWKALSDPNRRKIIELLSNKDLTPNEILENFNFSQPGLSLHLKILRNCGLVKCKRDGKNQVYSLVKSKVDPVFEFGIKLIGQGNKNLKNYLEKQIDNRENTRYVH